MQYSHIIGQFYFLSIVFIHIIYVAVFLGIFVNVPFYIRYLNFIIQVLLCAVLMIRFHPFREHELKKYDSRIIFSCAIFLMTNLLFVEGINQYITKYNISNIIK